MKYPSPPASAHGFRPWGMKPTLFGGVHRNEGLGASWSAPPRGWGRRPGPAQALANGLGLLLVLLSRPPEDHPA
jgi:hypothetical protein